MNYDLITYKSKRTSPIKIVLIALVIVFVIGLVGSLAFAALNPGDGQNPQADATLSGTVSDMPEKSIAQKPRQDAENPVDITVTLAGDCTLGTDENFTYSTSLNSYYESNGSDYFFQNVRPIFEADDLTVINMEGTFTESDYRTDKTYAFKGPPEYASILANSSIEAANLANNHSEDYGSQSYDDTIAAIEGVGVATFGFDRVKVFDIKGVKVGIAGIYELAKNEGAASDVHSTIAALKEQGAQVIIVSFHWGQEREYYPNETQKMLAHLAIDEGADLVVGHHPHVLQGIEKYRGKYIAYSLGNFCFGGNSNPSDKDTIIFQQTFTVTEEGVEVNDDIAVIPCSISSTSSYNDYCPTPLKDNDYERIMGRIEEYSAAL